jgi:hypothetical protein
MKAFMSEPVVRGIAVMLVLMALVSLVPRIEASFVSSDH